MTNNKITTAQIALLRKGDIIRRFPSNGAPEEQFDETCKENTDAFEIRSINLKNDMIELVTPSDSRVIFSSPGDISHLFIKSYNLVAQGIWWM
ncbi:hypothetical protein LQ567_16290 [Niabella pedocola]|uniref:Uncharacterized protein n=1 Tax=Niabella pedocola TaxID=1752077 RepID=A0ABS8PTE1_9BACT|nr:MULTISPECIES: hypothetical protein [Niabella]MBZ4189348.1 hypothetical protein [Niabella beijingensis]MCD2424340.1 hypothetical protein [Niabella pedocola]